MNYDGILAMCSALSILYITFLPLISCENQNNTKNKAGRNYCAHFTNGEIETQGNPADKERSHDSNPDHPGSKVRTLNLPCSWHCIPDQESSSSIDSQAAVAQCPTPWLPISPTHYLSLQLWTARLAWWQPTSLTQKPWPYGSQPSPPWTVMSSPTQGKEVRSRARLSPLWGMSVLP